MQNFDQEPTTVRECERLIHYHQMLLRSYNAKIERVEPGSEEFERTASAVLSELDILAELDARRVHLIHKQ
jgi:hypothetical protein